MRNFRFLGMMCAVSLLACAALVGCAANGGFASKSNGPVDTTVTLARVCTGVNGLDKVFKGISPGLIASGRISPADVAIEASVTKTFNEFCDPEKPPTDLGNAIAAVALASVDLGDLVAKLSGGG